jgi:hypothetical protein
MMQHVPRLLLALYAALALIGFQFVPPLPQEAAYHQFADTRAWLGVPNFANVTSNAALLLAGAWGLVALGARAGATAFRHPYERGLYAIFFGAVLLTAFGSTYYHAAPDDAGLCWDRLPLGLALTALPAVLIAERIALSGADRALLGLWLLIGPASVIYWYAGESVGQGDLRPFFLLHGFVLVLPPLLMGLPSPYTHARSYVAAYLVYLAAMAGEFMDRAIYGLGAIVSGHTLKHLLMGVAVILLARMLNVRRIRQEPFPHVRRDARSRKATGSAAA